MNAEVIAIGDELTSGQRLDTNSPWISQRLAELGIPVLFHTTVADELDPAAHVFRQAMHRVDVVVATGGLGPTADDLTRDALAQATGRPLVLQEAALEHIRTLFARRQRPMPERNAIQAMFPRGSRMIPNPHGTAPGIDLEASAGERVCRLFALPGVPAEMRQMWQESVAPALAAMARPHRVICHRSLQCFGVGESELEQMLPDLIRRGRVPRVGITATKTTLTLRVSAEGESAEDCERQIEPTIALIRNCLGKLVFGEDEDELQHAVVRLLRARGATVASVEIGSGGVVAGWLSEADRGGTAFVGGLVLRPAAEPGAVPADAARRGGPEAREVEHGPALRAAFDRRFTRFQTWREAVAYYAEWARDRFAADYGLAIGAFPQSDSPTDAPGEAHIAIACPLGTMVRTVVFAGHPDVVHTRTMKQALNELRLLLLHD